MIILALMGALIIGVSLGLLGSGGTIFTVPILVYLLKYPEKLAVIESMAIVNLIALAGMIPYGLNKQISGKSFLCFGIPGMIGSYFGADLSIYIPGKIQMIFFALIMLFVSWMMFFGSKKNLKKIPLKYSYNWMMIQGLLIGIMTGVIGCGGGFMIVPALILLNHLPILTAIGTSLLIIFFNTLIGFYKHFSLINFNVLEINWLVILIFSFTGIIGCYLGQLYLKKMPQDSFKRFFGVAVFLTAIYMIINIVV